MSENNTKKRIYIAGAGGMLGEAFYRVFNSEYDLMCTDKDVNESWLSFLDFRNAEQYRNDVKMYAPDYLFHLGAHTDLEYCELNIEDAYKTNTESVKIAVDIANELNIPLLYISTAGIFDGQKEFYNDWDEPKPLGHYANSKYLGEKHVVQHVSKHLVCRAGWMMGGGPKKDKKFINKLVKQIFEGRKELFIVDDKDGTPTFTIDFAKNVKVLLEKELWGLYNMVCKGQTSRFEVASELVNVLNLKDRVKITKVSSDFFKDFYFAPRPTSERLVNKRLEQLNLDIMQNWQTALREYIELYFKEYLEAKWKVENKAVSLSKLTHL